MKRLVITTLMIALLAAGHAAAQPHAGAEDGREHGQERIEQVRERLAELADEFGLTAGQKAEIRSVFLTAVPAAIDVAAGMAANREELAETVAAESFDVAAAERIASEQGALFTDLARIRADAFVDVRAVLGDAQLGLLTELRTAVADQVGEFAGIRAHRAERRQARRKALRGRIPGDRLAALSEEFGLTPEQRAEVRSNLRSAVPSVLEIAADMAANRQALAEAIRVEPVDAEAVASLTALQGELFAELVLVRADAAVAVRNALTDEQLEMLAERRSAVRARFAEFSGAL